MTDATTAELHDRFVDAVSDGDLERAATLERQIREQSEPIPDLLSQFNDAIENEEYEKGKTLLREIKRGYTDKRVDENAKARRIANARDAGALSGDGLADAEEFLRSSQSASMERLSFVSNAMVLIERQKAAEKDSVVETTNSLKKTEETVEETGRKASESVEDSDAPLPPSLEIIDTSKESGVAAGDAFSVSLEVYNSGEESATDVTPSVDVPDDVTVVSRPSPPGSLDGDRRRTLSYELRSSRGGKVAVTVRVDSENAKSASDRITIDVSDDGSDDGGNDGGGPPTPGDYTGSDDVVDTVDLQRAIQDWVTGDVDTTLLQELIQYWVSGETVN